MKEQVSQELAQKLVDAGVRVESKGYWTFSADGWNLEGESRYHYDTGKPKINGNQFPAPTFTEIWVVLSEYIECEPDTICVCCASIQMAKFDLKTTIGYRASGDYWYGKFSDESPAEAAGQLLLWLAENGYVEVVR